MSRPRQFFRGFAVRFTPLTSTFILYYAWKYRKDKTDIIRSMISAFVDADKQFDPDEYAAFMKNQFKNEVAEDEDEGMVEEMKSAAKTYAAGRKKKK